MRLVLGALALLSMLVIVTPLVSAQDIHWTKIYGDPMQDRAQTIEAISGGGYYLLGNSSAEGVEGHWDGRLYRLDDAGDSLWSVRLEHWAYDLVAKDDGGCVVLGLTMLNTDTPQVLLVEFDADGSVVDSAVLSSVFDQRGFDIERTADGGYVVCGQRSFPNNADTWVTLLDPDLDVVWEYMGGGDWVDKAIEIQPLLDGGFVFGGYLGIHDDTAMPYLVRLDVDGHEMWSRTYTCDSVIVRSFAVAANGDLVLGGMYSTGPNFPFTSPWMMRCAANGDSLWAQTYDYNIAGFDRLYPLVDGSMFTVGHLGEYLYVKLLANQIGTDGADLWSVSRQVQGYRTWAIAGDISSINTDSTFVACGDYGYWDIHSDSTDMFVTRMLHGEYSPAGPRVRLVPEPVPFQYAYLIEDTVGVDIFVGDFAGGVVPGDLDPGSIIVNDSLLPLDTEVLAYVPEFTGDVLKVTVSGRDFVAGYGALWDTTAHPISVRALLQTGGELEAISTVLLAGHLSGDLNGDLAVNIADLTYMFTYLLANGPAPRIPGSADVDASGRVNIADVTFMTAYLFADGPAPDCFGQGVD